MSIKTEKINDAINKLKQKKLVFYHVLSPITQQQYNQIKDKGYFEPCKNPLGGQSGGYYFFTTYSGALHHIETNKDIWGGDIDKSPYIAEVEIDLNTIKYPIWKLDYEAMQDFMFEMIYDVASVHSIKFDNIEIKSSNDKKLILCYDGKFSRIQSFYANKHSGLVEKIADFLYRNDTNFRKNYDELLFDVLIGKGENQELYAVKTTQHQKISKMIKIEQEPIVKQTVANSQIDKFLSRYARKRR